MSVQSKRQFIISCLSFILSGLGSAIISLFAGCTEKEKRSSLPEHINQEEKERLMVERTAKIGSNFEPAYLKLHRSGELKKRGEELWSFMESCEL